MEKVRCDYGDGFDVRILKHLTVIREILDLEFFRRVFGQFFLYIAHSNESGKGMLNVSSNMVLSEGP